MDIFIWRCDNWKTILNVEFKYQMWTKKYNIETGYRDPLYKWKCYRPLKYFYIPREVQKNKIILSSFSVWHIFAKTNENYIVEINTFYKVFITAFIYWSLNYTVFSKIKSSIIGIWQRAYGLIAELGRPLPFLFRFLCRFLFKNVLFKQIWRVPGEIFGHKLFKQFF